MSMTPQEIVSELDRHIVGQHAAKRAVAIALRNRWRRQQVDDRLRAEIASAEGRHAEALRLQAQAVAASRRADSSEPPMLAAGDEIGHTQRGNNNPYCQDNPITWLDWSAADIDLRERCSAAGNLA